MTDAQSGPEETNPAPPEGADPALPAAANPAPLAETNPMPPEGADPALTALAGSGPAAANPAPTALADSGPAAANPAPPAETNPALTALADSGIEHEVRPVARARSLEEAAAARGLRPGELIKSMVVRFNSAGSSSAAKAREYAVIMLPGDLAISWKKLRAYLGTSRAALPDADEAREVTGFERGTITPFGHGLRIIADVRVPKERISFGSGQHDLAVFANGADVLRAVNAEVADVADGADDAGRGGA